METQTSLTEKLEKFQRDDRNKKMKNSSKLTDLMEKLSKKGLLNKNEYSLPLKDTIGRTLHSQTKFSK